MRRKLLLLLLVASFFATLRAPVNTWWTYSERKYRMIELYNQMMYDREVHKYALALGWSESRLDWTALNKKGFMGTWQHGQALLADLGVYITPRQFKKDKNIFPPDLQYECLKTQIKVHTIQLQKYEAWIGHTVGGVYITRAGMLAGAHLGGVGAVKKFLYSGGLIDLSDGHTKISDYMKKFSIYNL